MNCSAADTDSIRSAWRMVVVDMAYECGLGWTPGRVSVVREASAGHRARWRRPGRAACRVYPSRIAPCLTAGREIPHALALYHSRRAPRRPTEPCSTRFRSSFCCPWCWVRPCVSGPAASTRRRAARLVAWLAAAVTGAALCAAAVAGAGGVRRPDAAGRRRVGAGDRTERPFPARRPGADVRPADHRRRPADHPVRRLLPAPRRPGRQVLHAS